MAVDDLDTLREQLPDLFQARQEPSGIDDDFIIVPVGDPSLTDAVEDVEAAFSDQSDSRPGFASSRTREDGGFVLDPNRRPRWPADAGVFAGGYRDQRADEPVPPPDAIAFYLPFHYYHPRWWGIYLIEEAVRAFGEWLSTEAHGAITPTEGFVVARLFVYGHEAFHHAVEAFATRLEIAHREPLYRTGFEALFKRVVGTDDCLEEAIANAAGLRMVRERAFKKPDQPKKRAIALEALRKYIKISGPGYRLGGRFSGDAPFSRGRAALAEENYRSSLPKLPGRDAAIWSTFPHAFSGISRVTSRVNYLVHRGSPLALRTGLGLRYFKRRDVVRRLQTLVGCRLLREGASHETWITSDGKKFQLPRHAGDLPIGTLKSILHQAGVSLPVSVFMSDRV